jgi:UDP-N-acetylmuramoylalanine--D-glutamate ligase
VTGTNGKSTVVTLVGEILRTAGKEGVVCGNIGRPLCGVLDRIRPSTVVILEVSSFQLEVNLAFHPGIACVLNVTTNHIDRHRSFARYREAKANLFTHQDMNGWTLLNADDPVSYGFKNRIQGPLACFSRTRRVMGASIADGALHLALPGVSGPICRRDELPKGTHHEENALAAAGLCGLLGVAPEISGEVLRSFQGLPHRQEVVATIRGVTFVNDSKSTTVASGLRAIQAAPGRVILIMGGRDKGSDFRKLKACARKLKAVVLMGEASSQIASHLKGSVALCKVRDLREAVQISFEMAQEGDEVLLSPMCTSFDMFRDFEERGEEFVETVKAMSATNHGGSHGPRITHHRPS